MTNGKCYRDRDNLVYFRRDDHRLDCVDPDCRGCQPCGDDHCTAKRGCAEHPPETEAHVGRRRQLTCARCIGRTRTVLRQIVIRYAEIPDEAAQLGRVDSEAMNLAGPATDPRGWSEHTVYEINHLDAWLAQGRITEDEWIRRRTAMEGDDEQHPYAVLTRWQMMLSEEYGHDLPTRLSVHGAADYLDRNLARVADDDGQDFPRLRHDLHRCLSHLEAVLSDSTQPDRGAPCPTCREHDEAVVRLVREYAHWCTEPTCERMHYLDSTQDRWVCPRNREHWWTHASYTAYLEDRSRKVS